MPASRRPTLVSEVVIAEPGDLLTASPGTLVLAVGARADDLPARLGEDAVIAVRQDPALPRAAERSGATLLVVAHGTRWDEVAAVVQGELARAAAADSPSHGDLYSLAQTVAALAGGPVSIEDTAHRVLAHAGSVDETDELRRRSVLGRACPEPYLALLREEGVHRRVRESEDVVEVGARPDIGARRRLVVGIQAGLRPLGTIWLQEGDGPLAEQAGEILRGAARLAAGRLVDHYYLGDPTSRVRSRDDLAHGLLTGRFNARALAVHLGVPPTAGASVVAVDLRDDPDGDTTASDARLAEASGMVAVHAAAYRRNALVAQACGQIYAMLPETGTADAQGALLRWAGDLVAVLRAHTRTPVQAVVAGTAARLDDIPEVKLRGHHGLQILSRTPDRLVASHQGLTSSLMVREALDVLARHGGVRHPGLATLVAHDRAHSTEMARSLLLYLDAFGDVGVAAKELNVHPNTLRYRVRKAVAVAGLDLEDPEHRLAAMIGLRLLTRADEEAGSSPYFPH
ncbi:hypothetical protein WN71_033375 [Streptomyces mangrovisoli]|uniref:PucR C-terminal helix-turn-helix domain-containing protein n=1 Tax=Streptomyces mangrovisoli TaxID=1428628 RepID=A0A1J4NN56_9ACTN|nr:hypothetical protein WN71_033375 [Streptomyces mangrovisoli]